MVTPEQGRNYRPKREQKNYDLQRGVLKDCEKYGYGYRKQWG